MGDVTPGILWIRSYHPTREVRCLLGDSAPRVVGPYTRYTTVDRPKRRSVPEWQGTLPLVVEVSFIIDYFSDPFPNPAVRCENDIASMEYFAGWTKDGDDEPPQVLWDANGPHDDADNGDFRWLVTNLTWGDAIWASTGRRIRQSGTLELTHQVDDDYIAAHGAQKARKKNKTEKPTTHNTKKHHTVRKGETLQKIAAKYLGNANLWTTIAKIQTPPIRDPKHLTVGRKLRLP